MRHASILIMVLATACVDTVIVPADDDESEATSDDGATGNDPDCTGTCSTHLEGSTGYQELCGLEGMLTDGVGTLYCGERSSCAVLDRLHRCRNDQCYDLCTVTAPSMISADCRSCLEGGCQTELDACVADVP